MTHELPARGRFEGLENIVRFNWPFYAVGTAAIGIAVAVAVVVPMPAWLALAVKIGAVPGAWWLAASLAASHWIYDRSPLYRWDWLGALFTMAPGRVVNVHAGFDESSDAVARLWPGAELITLDFYDPTTAPEPSIERARRHQPCSATVQSIRADAWPVSDASAELVLFCLAAHELRDRGYRAGLFREAARTLAPGGRVVLVEHLRDLANFIVFGPGFLHFLPRRDWLESFRDGGLVVVREISVTPFVRVFILERPC